ncbi:tigger transposable element-derived protein 1-like [Palaemon carinicauda]|uniref:tigger transposable element-derived protein 1-like n=1 Tax=Palaemon carinicauda TaxID=392227 RepID=UPI0035B613F3
MSTISTIIKQKEAIQAVKPPKGITIISKCTSPTMEEMERLLLIWIKDKETVVDTITETIICEKASAMNCDLKAGRGMINQSYDGGNSRYFTVGSRNLRDGPGNIQLFDMERLQVFNCDETSLFWKKRPSRTYITDEEKKMPGHKPMKDRLTLALCANNS